MSMGTKHVQFYIHKTIVELYVAEQRLVLDQV